MQNSSFSILLVKTSSIGDVIQTLPALQYLRARFPQATIDWVVEEPNASLLKASSLLSNIIVINTKLIHTWNRKNYEYHLNSRGILSIIVAVRVESDSRTFYIFLLTTSRKKSMSE